MQCDTSDHCPLLINMSGINCCSEIVEASWLSLGHDNSDGSILQQVEKCGNELSWWNRNAFGNVRKDLEQKKISIGPSQEGSNELWAQTSCMCSKGGNKNPS